MTAAAPPDLARQLADDLGWLEDHCRRQPDLAPHAARLRLAAALTRNVVGPAVGGGPPAPLFVAVVGGAGAGKSTVVNVLCGAAVAEANPQAGYTRHPTAFARPGPPWPTTPGFLGPLRELADRRPGNLDEDVYQVRAVAAAADDPLAGFVVWDCPDMTTWASGGYVGRLLEVAALADAVVYVASDERYNDEVPTQFLHLLIRAGKAVVVALTKMREADAPALVDHFRREVLGKLPAVAGADRPPIPCVPIPHLPAAARADPAGPAAAAVRARLVNQLLVLCPDPAAARRRTVGNAVRYLEAAADGLADVAKRDLAELDLWQAAVRAGRAGFEHRYRREFLAAETFRRFDRTKEQVLEMLELPGPGRSLSAALRVARLPYRYAKDAVARAVARPDVPALSEHTICTAALAGWLDALQAEALKRAGSHPVWGQIAGGFEAGLKGRAADRFADVYRRFERTETDELDHAARQVPEFLAANPRALAAARAAAAGLDLAAAGAGLWAGWSAGWWGLLLVPAAVAASRQAVEVGVGRAVDRGRGQVRERREALVADHLAGPLADWLADWPTAAGSPLEKLRQVLERVPAAVRHLGRLADPPPAAGGA